MYRYIIYVYRYIIYYYRWADDATVIDTWKETSYTPGVGQVLFLPPHMRQTASGYLLLMVLPPKVKNYKVLYLAMLEEIRSQGKPIEEGEGQPTTIHNVRYFPWVKFEVEDHAVSPPVVRDQTVVINHIVGDTRGTPNCTGSKQSPCINGMCNQCTQKGVQSATTTEGKKSKNTNYKGAVRFLGDRYR